MTRRRLVGAVGKQRAAILCAWLILCTAGGVLLGSAILGHQAHATPASPQSGSRYGPSDADVLKAITQSGQQKNNNYCGVATIAAIADFVGAPVSQDAVAAYLNSTGSQSPWGTPWTGSTWGFRADISRDLGTDPRSLAAGLTQVTGSPYRQAVGRNGVYSATGHLIYDLLHSNIPISAIVLHGQHSVLVTGVYATSDQPWNDFSTITGIEVWDPGAGTTFGGIQGAARTTIPLNTWLYDEQYWGAPYNANYNGGTAFDPDPVEGPYDVGQRPPARLWIGNYVYLRPWGAATPDWAFTDGGALIRGIHDEVPDGYGGASIPIVPPPPPPTPTPRPTATPQPTATPIATATPTATATPVPTATPLPTATPIPTPLPTATPQTTGVRFPDLAGAWDAVCQADWCGSLATLPAWAIASIGGGSAVALLGLVTLMSARRRRKRRRKLAEAKARAHEQTAQAEFEFADVAAADAPAAEIGDERARDDATAPGELAADTRPEA